METGRTWELCQSGPWSCLVLGLILILPCKVAEGDKCSVGSLNLSRMTEEPWNDTGLTSPVQTRCKIAPRSFYVRRHEQRSGWWGGTLLPSRGRLLASSAGKGARPSLKAAREGFFFCFIGTVIGGIKRAEG